MLQRVAVLVLFNRLRPFPQVILQTHGHLLQSILDGGALVGVLVGLALLEEGHDVADHLLCVCVGGWVGEWVCVMGGGETVFCD